MRFTRWRKKATKSDAVEKKSCECFLGEFLMLFFHTSQKQKFLEVVSSHFLQSCREKKQESSPVDFDPLVGGHLAH